MLMWFVTYRLYTNLGLLNYQDHEGMLIIFQSGDYLPQLRSLAIDPSF